MVNNSLSQDLKETSQLTKDRLVLTGPLGGSRHHPVQPENRDCDGREASGDSYPLGLLRVTDPFSQGSE